MFYWEIGEILLKMEEENEENSSLSFSDVVFM